MNPKRGMILLGVLLLSALSAQAGIASGFDTDYNEYGVDISSPVKDSSPTPYVSAAALKLNFPMERLVKMEKMGFGRSEMVAMVLILRGNAETKWDSLLKAREEGRPLGELAVEAGLDRNDLFRRSLVLRDEIMAEAAVEVSTGAVSADKTRPPLLSR